MALGLYSSISKDTIAAVATPTGPGGIGILRISGPRAWEVGGQVFHPANKSLSLQNPPVRQMIYGFVRDPATGEVLDEVLCVFFRGPFSYAAEDAVEIQGHGGPAILRRILEVVLGLGCRLARPGEFTYRAFMNGRLDLSQAEAVAQLVQAGSEMEARLALGALAGGLSARLSGVREALTKAAAAVEAAVDFPDEVAEIAGPELAQDMEKAALKPLAGIVKERRQRRVFREGALVVLCGRPNVGKSSLFNALLGHDRAIVTSQPGTTRDAIEESALLGQVVCRLTDTAGLAQAQNEAEALGMAAAQGRLAAADLALVVLDGSQPLTGGDQATLAATGKMPRIIVVNKCDLPPAWELSALDAAGQTPRRVSAKYDMGVDGLAQAVGQTVAGGRAEPKPGEVVVSARQAEALKRCLAAAARAADGLSADDVQPELVSLDLAEALAVLGEVDGKDAPDQVIEAIFRDFCVGK